MEDVTGLADRSGGRLASASVQYSDAYILLLARATLLAEGMPYVQFGIVRSRPAEDVPTLVFMSPWHRTGAVV